MRLLWGTANLFSHPRYAAGAATNPDPEVFSFAAAQVKSMLEVTKRLGGANYVLWGGREGYETLLNTDLVREENQLARFLSMVAEHKHRIGFKGTLLIEPKPQEPTKHQYDYDTADDPRLPRAARPGRRVPPEPRGQPRDAGRAQLPPRGRVGDRRRYPRQHRREPRRLPERLGHGPVPELGRRAVARRSTRSSGPAGSRPAGSTSTRSCAARASARDDLFHAHIGGIDTLARSLLVAAALIESGELERLRSERYGGWTAGLGRDILEGRAPIEVLAGQGPRRRDRPGAGVRTPGAARERRQPGDLVGRPGRGGRRGRPDAHRSRPPA